MQTFTLTDPLQLLAVTIHILVQPHTENNPNRDSRPVMVAVGIEGVPPKMLTGTFADIPALIDEAWRTTATATENTAPQVIAHATEIAAAPVESSAPTLETPTPTPATTPTQGILDLF